MSEDIIMSRRPPLHTCAASFLAIIHIACRKAQEINNGGLGTLTKVISKPLSIALPLIYALQYQLLAILRFFDDWILKFEKFAEIIFPLSTILFDKIDVIVSTVETIPERFDDALNNGLPVNFHRANSFSEWKFLQILIWVLDLNDKEEEKEILIDMNSSSLTTTESSASAAAAEEEEEEKVKDENCPPVLEDQDQESVPESEKKTESLPGKDKLNVELSGSDESGKSVSSGSFNEAGDGDDSCNKESAGKKSKMKTGEERTGEKQKNNKEEKDPVLELFESKWLI